MDILREEEVSPSSSSATPRGKYDVFLSFRGEDIRKNFTDHLYTALKLKDISIFRDDERLERGKPISLELLKAVEESRFAVIVLSRNYAASTWCLGELAKIVECMKETELMVLPVFYDVTPSEVRKQTGSFGEAFAKHEERSMENMETIQKWRDALRVVGNLSGWHLVDRYESEVIHQIVGKILGFLRSIPSVPPEDLVGIDSRVEGIMKSYLRIDLDDVRFMGICGMGGMGKTTLVRAIYERISNQFQGSTFLADVRETVRKHDLVHLQKELLSDILMGSRINIGLDVQKGIHIIKNRLLDKRVLIILDGVDQSEQLRALAGGRDWFGGGSTIIVTTRNKDLLKQHGLVKEEIYEAKELNNDEALQLFCRRAFKKDHPPENYMEMSKKVVDYAKGLPLALEVLGSSLFDSSEDVWRSTLSSLKNNPNKEILDTLQISFDGLAETQKNTFLDIACFFNGKDEDRVVSILESCGSDYSPNSDIKFLTNKSLITISENKLWMHDLLEDLGREIVRRESPKKPGKRSRLWHSKDACRVLKENEGKREVEGIFLNFSQQEEVRLNPESFSKMTRLRLLKICNVQLPEGLNCLSNELRVMEWCGYPLTSLPMNFQPNKLLELNMCCSRIEQLHEGILSSDKLKLIDMSDSKNLIKFPDFARVQNLEKLILQGCTRLLEVHPSIGLLKRLILLNLQDCNHLNSLPSKISLESLKVLILSGCSRLEKFPEIEGNMTHLSKLYLDRTTIKDLPLSFGLLTGLAILSLRDCKNLSTLPSVVCSLTSLKTLTLSGCSHLDKMPETLGDMECLEELDASKTAVTCIPQSILLLKNLKQLSFHGCKGPPPKSWNLLVSCCLLPSDTLEPICLSLPNSFSGLSSLESLNLSDCNLLDGAIPNDLSGLSSLWYLDLSGNDFTSLPESFCQLSNLKKLSLSNCSKLRSLPELPSSILPTGLLTNGCTSLDTYADLI